MGVWVWHVGGALSSLFGRMHVEECCECKCMTSETLNIPCDFIVCANSVLLIFYCVETNPAKRMQRREEGRGGVRRKGGERRDGWMGGKD